MDFNSFPKSYKPFIPCFYDTWGKKHFGNKFFDIYNKFYNLPPRKVLMQRAVIIFGGDYSTKLMSQLIDQIPHAHLNLDSILTTVHRVCFNFHRMNESPFLIPQVEHDKKLLMQILLHDEPDDLNFLWLEQSEELLKEYNSSNKFSESKEDDNKDNVSGTQTL